MGLFGSLVGAIAIYLFSIVAARGLDVGLYGQFVLACSIVNLMGLVSLFGFDRGVLRFVALYRGLGDKARERGIVLQATAIVGLGSILVGALVLLFSGPIALLFGDSSSELPRLIRVLAFSMPAFAFMTLFGSIANAQKRVRFRVVATNFVQPLSQVLIAALLLAIGFGLSGVLIARIVSYLLAAGAAFWFVRSYFVNGTVTPRYEFRSVVTFSIPVLLLSVLARSTNQLEIYLLGFLQTPEAVGIFHIAARTAVLGSMFLRSLRSIFGPLIAELDSRGEKQELARLLRLVTRWSITINIPILLVISLFSKSILAISGEQYSAGSMALIVLSLGQFVNGATGPVGNTLVMSGHPGLNLFNSILTLVLNFALDVWLIPKLGIVGAAIGSACTIACVNLLRLVQVRLLLGLSPYDIKIGKPLVAGTLAGAMIWSVKRFVFSQSQGVVSLGLGAVVTVVLYVTLVAILGMEQEDRAILRSWAARLVSMATHLKRAIAGESE